MPSVCTAQTVVLEHFPEDEKDENSQKLLKQCFYYQQTPFFVRHVHHFNVFDEYLVQYTAREIDFRPNVSDKHFRLFAELIRLNSLVLEIHKSNLSNSIHVCSLIAEINEICFKCETCHKTIIAGI